MKDSKQELILREIETNRELLKELNSKVERLIELNEPKKKKKTPQSKPIKKETKKTYTASELSKKYNLEKREEKTIDELIRDVEEYKEKKLRPKFKTPLPST